MKRFLLKSLAFLVFLIPLYAILLLLWGLFVPAKFGNNLFFPRGGNGHLHTRIKELDKYNKVDILFLGSSHAYRGFDPRVFSEEGWTSFNLGSSNQTPLQTHVLLKRYLNQLNPQVILYAVSPESFQMDGIESALDILANSPPDSLSFKMVRELHHIQTYHAWLYASMLKILGIGENFREAPETFKDVYVSGGFVENKLRGFSADFEKGDLGSEFDYQWTHFESVVTRARLENIPLVLVATPLAPSHPHRKNPPVNWQKRIATYSTFIDFNSPQVNWTVDDFFDADHLNQQGVMRFNRMVLDSLRVRKLIESQDALLLH